MGDRAVDCARLESVCAARHQGFESPPIRFPRRSCGIAIRITVSHNIAGYVAGVRACSETFRKYVIGLSHGTDAPVIAIDNVNECRVLPTVLLRPS